MNIFYIIWAYQIGYANVHCAQTIRMIKISCGFYKKPYSSEEPIKNK